MYFIFMFVSFLACKEKILVNVQNFYYLNGCEIQIKCPLSCQFKGEKLNTLELTVLILREREKLKHQPK